MCYPHCIFLYIDSHVGWMTGWDNARIYALIELNNRISPVLIVLTTIGYLLGMNSL